MQQFELTNESTDSTQ